MRYLVYCNKSTYTCMQWTRCPGDCPRHCRSLDTAEWSLFAFIMVYSISFH